MQRIFLYTGKPESHFQGVCQETLLENSPEGANRQAEIDRYFHHYWEGLSDAAVQVIRTGANAPTVSIDQVRAEC